MDSPSDSTVGILVQDKDDGSFLRDGLRCGIDNLEIGHLMVVNPTDIHVTLVHELHASIISEDSTIRSPINERAPLISSDMLRNDVRVVLKGQQGRWWMTSLISGRQILVGMVDCPALILHDSMRNGHRGEWNQFFSAIGKSRPSMSPHWAVFDGASISPHWAVFDSVELAVGEPRSLKSIHRTELPVAGSSKCA